MVVLVNPRKLTTASGVLRPCKFLLLSPLTGFLQDGSERDMPVNLVLSRAADKAEEIFETIGKRGVLRLLLRLHNEVVSLYGTGRHGIDIQKPSLQCVESVHALLRAGTAFRSFFSGGDTAK